jgi:hypothetical protein
LEQSSAAPYGYVALPVVGIDAKETYYKHYAKETYYRHYAKETYYRDIIDAKETYYRL